MKQALLAISRFALVTIQCERMRNKTFQNVDYRGTLFALRSTPKEN